MNQESIEQYIQKIKIINCLTSYQEDQLRFFMNTMLLQNKPLTVIFPKNHGQNQNKQIFRKFIEK